MQQPYAAESTMYDVYVRFFYIPIFLEAGAGLARGKDTRVSQEEAESYPEQKKKKHESLLLYNHTRFISTAHIIISSIS